MAQVVRGLKKGPALYHIRRPLYYLIVAAGPKPFVFYPLKGQASSTVVPCMNSMWYKCLNGLIISLALVAFVLAAPETTISPTGQAVTYWVPPS
jgi:hypothetical protein